MIDLGSGTEWEERLKPIQVGPLDDEPFSAWWGRHSEEFKHLDPQVLEQWVHRHWRRSPFRRLPLSQLRSRRETWSTEQILRGVYNDDIIEPKHDFQVFAEGYIGKTMLLRGTWDCPMLILSTPEGFKDQKGEHPDARFRLIEGHRRFRFLNALAHRRQACGPHEVLIISLDNVDRRSS